MKARIENTMSEVEVGLENDDKVAWMFRRMKLAFENLA